jgi:hypothetical protein
VNIRQAIITAIVARFTSGSTAITLANGYQTNCGSKGKEWQTTPLDAAQMDAILVRDTIDKERSDPNGQLSSKHTWELEIVVDAVLAESGQNAAQARKAISDINKAVAVDHTWGGLAKRSEQVSEQLMTDREGTRVGGAQVIFKVITSRRPWEA